jgi:uncharacterized protein (TIGR02271 family)
MGKTAVGLYETSAEARQVLNELISAGFDRNSVRIMLGDQSNRQLHEWLDDQPGRATASQSQWSHDSATSMLSSIGVPRADAQHYEEALHRGHALVSASTSDQRIDEAVDIMSHHKILDIHEQMRSWNTADDKKRSLQSGEEATLPVIEEEIRVGKREVERGGVRVRAHVTETPVDETVNLREEHVEVERHPVNRPAGQGDIDKLRDQTIEVRESGEEAIVSKEARVVEEVVVRKDVDTRQEHIRDTVRRTDVDVEQMGSGDKDWERYNNDFQTHYNTHFANSGRAYSAYQPAYRYGYTLASRPDWRGRSWSQIEPDARRQWESEYRQQGAWDDFKDAVRHGWQRVAG